MSEWDNNLQGAMVYDPNGDLVPMDDRPAVSGAQDSPEDGGFAGASALLAQTLSGGHYLFSGNQDIDATLIGSKWLNFNQTYSFPTAANQLVGYPAGSDEIIGFTPFNAQQQTAAKYAYKLLQAYTNLTFSQITETTTTHATHRLDQTTDTTGPSDIASAYANFPSDFYGAGDVWFGKSSTNPQPFYLTPQIGNWGQATMMHEIGHSLGLKHGHQDYTTVNLASDLHVAGPRFGSQALPPNHDGQAWSLMTYDAAPGQAGGFYGEGSNQPQTYMQDDIAALQYVYGANFNYHAGDNVYTWSPTTGQMFIDGTPWEMPTANKIFMTIWDGGGHDTFDLSNYTTNMKIDLTPGNFSTFDQNQVANTTALLGTNNPAPGNVATALLNNGNTASLIEDVKGGTGNDTIIGNQADNTIWGGKGNNVIDGGAGTDTVMFDDSRYLYSRSGAPTAPVFTGTSGSAVGTSDTITNVEKYSFPGNTPFNSNNFENFSSVNQLPRNDDGSSSAIDISSVFLNGINFYGHSFTSLYANNNGNLTFGSPLSSYTPNQIGGSSGIPIIAPFWADVDTRLAPPANGGYDTGHVDYNLDPIHGTVTITYDHVDYYSTQNTGPSNPHVPKFDTFQVELIDQGSGDFEIVFRYSDLNWTTGDASGGTNGLGGTIARAGFSAGDGMAGHYYELPESGLQGPMLGLNAQQGDTGVSGLWQFQVRNGAVNGLGTPGNDVIHLPNTGGFADAGAGNDTVYGGTGNDHIYGRAGDDVIFGGGGNDYIEGDAGNDYIVGGTGNDTIYGDTTAASTNGPTPSGDPINKADGSVDTTAQNGPADANAPGDGNDTIVAGGGNALIYGGGGNDVIIGGTGADTMYGGTGDDTFFVNSPSAVVIENAGEGTDTVYASISTYVLPANVEVLVGTGSTGEYFVGNNNDDLIIGGAGFDTITAGTGSNQLYGGAGGSYIVGGTGHDTIVGGGGFTTLYGNGSGDDYIVGGFGSSNVLAENGTGSASLWGGLNGDDYIVGGVGNDLVVGGGATNYLFGGSGDDTIYGGNGTSYIYPGAGNDFIWTHNVGQPHLTDYVYEGVGTGVDTIADFQPGDDANHGVLVMGTAFSNIASFADVQAKAFQAGVYTVLPISATDQVYLYNVQPFQLTSNDFIFT